MFLIRPDSYLALMHTGSILAILPMVYRWERNEGVWRGRLLQPTKSSEKSSFLKFPYYQKKIHWLLTIILVINTKQVIFCTKAYLSSIHNQKYRRKVGQNYENILFYPATLYSLQNSKALLLRKEIIMCNIPHFTTLLLALSKCNRIICKIERCSQIWNTWMAFKNWNAQKISFSYSLCALSVNLYVQLFDYLSVNPLYDDLIIMYFKKV